MRFRASFFLRKYRLSFLRRFDTNLSYYYGLLMFKYTATTESLPRQ
eukprot:COSAG06_NODE_70655_length_191_cov_15.195652_1_plen_45_part_01